MMPRSRTQGMPASLLAAGTMIGVVDAFLGLAANPDPGEASYVAGLVLGPILLGVAYASAVGAACVAGTRVVARRGTSAALAVGAVAAVWLASIVADAVAAGRTHT
ncbi:MAG: hypothetical protein AB1689_05810, partial [Thermodesulfobacteriota bacterium]